VLGGGLEEEDDDDEDDDEEDERRTRFEGRLVEGVVYLRRTLAWALAWTLAWRDRFGRFCFEAFIVEYIVLVMNGVLYILYD